MRDSSKTVRCLFCFMFIAELGASLNCTTSCGNRGVDIRFPFWIKDRQPDQCGYPGFALSCNERGDIVLQLPTAGKLQIEKIDYRNQLILASDPQGCLLRQHSNFNSSVFNLQFEKSKVNFTIFNCSLNNTRPLKWMAPCLSTAHYDVLAVDSELSIEDNESLLSCTKMYDLPVPHDIRLSWSSPNCGSCEATGKQCRLRKNSITELETECYGWHRQDKGTWKKRLAIGVTTGSILFAILVIAVYHIYSFRKSEEEYQAKVESSTIPKKTNASILRKHLHQELAAISETE
ncbi:SERINE/THREONINE KINASE putative-RELATED [Salix koriyanagi]|uniref:RING-type E3 ubiquitin transferase n=1 Tax=Salix koriyanagi TaxID=2511006 RepID=A0A9Q0ZGM9_9ROSI|nr:SERINE/THREONINE KINASE putative-RELATED [Salix koriyanagi]